MAVRLAATEAVASSRSQQLLPSLLCSPARQSVGLLLASVAFDDNDARD